MLRIFFYKKHRQLPRRDNMSFSRFTFEGFHIKVKIIWDHILDTLQGDLFPHPCNKFVNHLLGQIDVDLSFIETGLRDLTHQKHFQLSDIYLHLQAYNLENLEWNI